MSSSCCVAGGPAQELSCLVLLGLGGTAGTMLFTSVNPVAGAIFGGTYFLTSRAVRMIATKVFGELNIAKSAVCDLIALPPAIGITIGVLIAGAVTFSPATLAIIVAAALVGYLLFQSIFLIRHCIQSENRIEQNPSRVHFIPVSITEEEERSHAIPSGIHLATDF